MKQYNRAAEKRLDLTSVEYHTNMESNGKRAPASRKNQRRPVLAHREDDEVGQCLTSGSGSPNRSAAIQHQQSHAKEGIGEHRISSEYGGIVGSRTGANKVAKDVGDAA